MKSSIILSFLLTLATVGKSQWTTSGSNLYWNVTGGKLGIGTSSPTNTLDVIQNTFVNAVFRITSTNAPNSGVVEAYASSIGGFLESNITPTVNVRVGSRTNNDFYLASNNTNWMVIKTSGKIGINNTSPNYQLDVNGIVNATGFYLNGSPFTTGSGWSLTGNAGTVDGTNFIGTSDNVPLSFRVNNIKSGRIDPALYSTFFGAYAGSFNTTGYENTAIGYAALNFNTSGNQNGAIGVGALNLNTTGSGNNAMGFSALSGNTTGTSNTAIGGSALQSNTNGFGNTSIGLAALAWNTTGGYNTAIGYSSGPSTSSSGLSNTTAIGNGATPTATNTIVIGNSSVTSIGGQVSWSTLSDGRFKTNVNEDVLGLDFIKKLRPVSYDLNTEAFDKFTGAYDKLQKTKNQSAMDISQSEVEKPNPIRRTGLIAQEVEIVLKSSGKIFSGLVTPQSEKDHYSLRYSDFVMPLIRSVQELSNQITKQNGRIDSLTNVIKTLKGQPNTGQMGNSLLQGQAVLNQNFPNPFSSNTQISMVIPETTQSATLMITNLQGAQLKSIVINSKGNVSITINDSDFGAGIYLYSLIVNNQLVDTKRMVLTN